MVFLKRRTILIILLLLLVLAVVSALMLNTLLQKPAVRDYILKQASVKSGYDYCKVKFRFLHIMSNLEKF